MAGDAVHMRVVINFDREPDPRWFLLRSPHRLVIDLPKTQFAIDPKELKARGLVKNVRYGHINDKTSRLILEAKGPFVVDKIDILPNEALPNGGSAATAWWRTSRQPRSAPSTRRSRCRLRRPARQRRRRKANAWA